MRYIEQLNQVGKEGNLHEVDDEEGSHIAHVASNGVDDVLRIEVFFLDET